MVLLVNAWSQWSSSNLAHLLRDVKLPQNLPALMVYIFRLDAKNEEKVKKVLKISLALT